MDSDPEDDDLLDITPELLKAVTSELIGCRYNQYYEDAKDAAKRIINVVFDHVNLETSNEPPVDCADHV